MIGPTTFLVVYSAILFVSGLYVGPRWTALYYKTRGAQVSETPDTDPRP